MGAEGGGVVAIDCSGRRGSVALWRPFGGSWEGNFVAERAKNAAMFGPLEVIWGLCCGAPELVVAGTGPGSPTGTRLGIAAATGLALAAGVEVVGWPSLAGVCGHEEGAVVGDARRGKAFVARLGGGRLVEGPEVVEPGAVAGRVEGQCGGVVTLDDELPGWAPEGTKCAAVSAAVLAERAWRAWRNGELCGGGAVEPIYLQAPFVSEATKNLPLVGR
jgi:tRNA threonylcarbamoyladenosine biosynthesis protein TsaB